MKRETISLALSGIDERFIRETEEYRPGSMHRIPERTPQMKNRRILSAALAAALILALGVTAFAVAGLFRSIATRPMPKTGEYADLSDVPKIERDVGYDVTVVEEFSNGYRFSGFRVQGEAVYGENNEVLEEYYTVCETYTDPGGKKLLVTLSPVLETADARPPEPTERRTFNGVEVGLSLDHYKLVPEGYEKTEEDLARESGGHFFISYGPGKITEQDYAFAEFALDGVRFMLMDEAPSGNSLDELAGMAEELIAAANN